MRTCTISIPCCHSFVPDFPPHHCKVEHEVGEYGKGKYEREGEKCNKKNGGGWGERGAEKQIWRLGWWECTALHRCTVPLGNLSCEQIRLNARVSRKEPPSRQSIGGGGGGRLAGWRYYCVKTSDPGHHHQYISCITLLVPRLRGWKKFVKLMERLIGK